jgi:RNA polymerase sigma factor (sigma-70 family)
MPTGPIIQQLRRAALRCDGGGLSDGQLLGCFLERRDEAAFEALVRRHAPMVLGVCRRVVGNVHDAEDAFQATFLVLVRKAASVRPREAVGSWLYGVAYRTALGARARLVRRRAKERQVEEMPQPEVEPAEPPRELLALLDRELSRLPEHYRVPVVLCDLEGRPRREVARRLGLPEGTLSSRLAKARKLLARRLKRHGPALAGGALAAALTQEAASACVPNVLIVTTTRAALLVAAGKAAAGAVPAQAAVLAEGVLRAMLLNTLKIVTAGLLAAALTLGAGVSLYYSCAAGAERAAAADPNRNGEPGKVYTVPFADEGAAADDNRKAQPVKADSDRGISKEELGKITEQINKAIEAAARQQYNRGYLQGLRDHIQDNCAKCHKDPHINTETNLHRALQKLGDATDRKAELQAIEQLEKILKERKKDLQQEKDDK